HQDQQVPCLIHSENVSTKILKSYSYNVPTTSLNRYLSRYNPAVFLTTLLPLLIHHQLNLNLYIVCLIQLSLDRNPVPSASAPFYELALYLKTGYFNPNRSKIMSTFFK